MKRHSGRRAPIKWYGVLLQICFAPVAVLITFAAILTAPVLIFKMITEERKQREKVRQFLRRQGARALLVWHSRRGWNEFGEKNLLPALPEGIVAVHDRRRRDSTYRDRRSAEQADGVSELARPYLLFFHKAKLQAISLNRVLWPLKHQGKPSLAVQREVSRIILDHVADSPIRLDSAPRDDSTEMLPVRD